MKRKNVIFLIVITLGIFGLILFLKGKINIPGVTAPGSGFPGGEPGGGGGAGGGSPGGGYIPGREVYCFNFEMLSRNNGDDIKFANFSKYYTGLTYPFTLETSPTRKFLVESYWLCRKVAFGTGHFVYFRNRFIISYKTGESGKRQIIHEMKKAIQGLSQAYVVYKDSVDQYPYGVCDVSINYKFVRGSE